MFSTFQDGDSSSTTSSVEIMDAEDLESSGSPISASPTGSLTGPKFVLRLASREHLGNSQYMILCMTEKLLTWALTAIKPQHK